MNLQTHIRQELWLAIASTYEAKNYSHAVLDAMHYLSDVIREKANVDGDGVGLVGKALGGETPRLRVNKLQTETERDIQKGLEQITRGLYLGIRNPRSHEQIQDTPETADAIIYFINYLLGVLAKSEEPFTIQSFLSRVFDPDFVKSPRYAELLAAEIPDNKRLDTLIELYRRKEEGEGEKLKFMVKAILDQLSEEQQSDFLEVISDELKTTINDKAVRITLNILPVELWPKLSEVSRLRTENKLINSIKEGEIDFETGKIYQSKGVLGAWSRDFIPHFKLKQQLWNVVIKKLEGEQSECFYVAKYFLDVLPHICETSYKRDRCIEAITKEVLSGNSEMRNSLVNFFGSFPDDWQNEIRTKLKSLEESEPDYYEKLIDIPF